MNASFPSAKTSLVWIVALAALAAASAMFMWRGAAKAMKMQPDVATNSQFAKLKSQQMAKIVVEISETSENRILGSLLEKQDDTHYTRTTSQVEIHSSNATAIVMGQAADLRTDAVIHVTGAVRSDHSLEVRQIVILTGYVHVK